MRKLAPLLLTVMLLLCAVPSLSDPALSEPVAQGFYGTILNETGVPMPGVMVTARNTTTDASLTTITNGAGIYQMTAPSGTYNVSASFLNYNPNASYADMVIPVGGSTELNFTMFEILGTLHGFVIDGVVPVNGVTVTLANNQRSYNTLTVAPLGEYLIGNIRPGVYVATFTKNGYDRTNSLPLAITRGVTSLENATMRAQPCTLFGQVTENGNPQEGVTITARGQDNVRSGTSDAKGNYSIQLTSDTYNVTFTKKDFDAKVMSVSLAPFEDRRLDVSIVKSKNNNTATYLFGFDLPHSLMILGLIMALATICIALFINFKVRKKPELLGNDPQEDKNKERS